MPHASRLNFENFGHTTKNTIFRIVKHLADLSTRLKPKLISQSFQSSPAMHVAWSYCQAPGLVAKRKTNQLEQFKKKSLLVHKEIKIKKYIKCSANVIIYVNY